MTAKIALTEVFAAPQGEGFHAGRWAIFVRLAGCPLACEFSPGVVCDTPYMQVNLKLTLDELFGLAVPDVMGDATKNYCGTIWDAPMLIITGGEPTFAPQFDAIVDAALAMTPALYVAVETNGTKWSDGLHKVDWISVSPKENVKQTSTAKWHHGAKVGPTLLDPRVSSELQRRAYHKNTVEYGAEYRYVITADSSIPPFLAAQRHYISPAVLSAGSGTEWQDGFPGYSTGAVERCLKIVEKDPRWRISTQIHKMLGVR